MTKPETIGSTMGLGEAELLQKRAELPSVATEVAQTINIPAAEKP